MKVYMERQSVSMRDDKNAPNRRMIEVLENCRIKDFIKILIKNYCPKVTKSKAVWVLWYEDKLIAVFDSVLKSYKSMFDENIALKDIVNKKNDIELYLYYKGNVEIDYVLEEVNSTFSIV